MQIDLTLRESIRLKLLLEKSMQDLSFINDDNYPSRKKLGAA